MEVMERITLNVILDFPPTCTKVKVLLWRQAHIATCQVLFCRSLLIMEAQHSHLLVEALQAIALDGTVIGHMETQFGTQSLRHRFPNE